MQLPPPRYAAASPCDLRAKQLLPPPLLRHEPLQQPSRRSIQSLPQQARPQAPLQLPAQQPQPAQLPQQPLGPGVVVPLAGRRFVITQPLGKGSFGVVWEARDERGSTVALKEIRCKSESDVARVKTEGRVLDVVRREVAAAGLAADLVPALVAMEVQRTEQKRWRVQLAMSLVPGAALETHLEARRQEIKVQTDREPQEQFAEACLCAGQLLLQLAPVLDAFSTSVYHRDITPRNIQINHQDRAGGPSFGLVDFGLAVDAVRWRAGEAGAGDLGGDGRYWPASSWYVFCFGTRALERDEWLRAEYRTSLDAHSLGLTALRCLVELLPPCQGNSGVDRALQRLRAAWQQYWSDARRLWQPIFDAFRGSGNFDELRTQFTKAKAHLIVTEDLCALRQALRDLKRACGGLPVESGLAGMPALCEALLLMVQAGCADDAYVAAPAHSKPSSRPASSAHVRQPSQSTASPSSDSSGALSGGSSFGF